MQLSVLFGALVSLAIHVTALPMPGATSKRSSKRENLDIDFQLHGSVESKNHDELDTNPGGYIENEDYGGDPDSTSRAIEEREELESNLITYNDYGYCIYGVTLGGQCISPSSQDLTRLRLGNGTRNDD
ncbi:hypothetical protein BDR04DRAFT_1119377 [Suillus decipiens]|nr:hypothetical protein BDR04DRAFT_1119377 [Suillus decipiens]